jgi:uncharacterized protein (DUF4415 family)
MSISKKRLNEIEKMSDSQIDTSDIPELGPDFWDKAKLKMPESKVPISFRIDKDVLSWYKTSGHRYQTRMNAVLRSFMEAHSK